MKTAAALQRRPPSATASKTNNRGAQKLKKRSSFAIPSTSVVLAKPVKTDASTSAQQKENSFHSIYDAVK